MRSRKTLFLAAFLACLVLPTAGPAAAQEFPDDILGRMNLESCSSDVEDRLASYRDLVERVRALRGGPEDEMLSAVNLFFYRQIRLIPDTRIWGVVDYWSTLIETLCIGDGDSEDFSIAKYFTLAGIGVPEDRLRLVYATSDYVGPTVVLFYDGEDGEERILHQTGMWSVPEVISGNILEPVYAFNSQTFWIVGETWLFTPIRDARNLSQWQRILRRMESARRN